MTVNCSLESLLEELSVLNRVHMGLEKTTRMTRSYERGRHAMLVKQLEDHRNAGDD